MAWALVALVLGCGSKGPKSSTAASSNQGGQTPAASNAGQPGGAADAGTAGTGGSDASGGSVGSGEGGSGNATSHVGELTPPGDDASRAQACRFYFDTICARIRDCEAPTFRPCASPADLCPDILFSSESTWTVPEVLSCAEQWTTHSCDELRVDRWPACSQRSGEREDGSDCVFDAQCQSGVCLGGMVPEYQLTCGQCVSPAPRNGACDEHTPCSMGQTCQESACVDISEPAPGSCGPTMPCPTGQRCAAGHCEEIVEIVEVVRCDDATPCPAGQVCHLSTCVDPLPLGATCTRTTPCEEGFVCGIELAPEGEDEPTEGTCQPLPPIGEPCVPTFVSMGACAEGATCTSRPTGDCVALRQIGESCGYTQCVQGAYCNTYGSVTDVPSHTCYADRVAGEPCFGWDEICAEGLACLCSGTDCASTICAVPRPSGESCDSVTALCAESLTCVAGTCVDPTSPDAGTEPDVSVLGRPCTRTHAYGREPGDCNTQVEGIECLCADPKCTVSYCAQPRLEGQDCESPTALCRQGLACLAGQCVALDSLGIETESCSAS
ncbi:MAG: hypothetical protein JW940_35060 [Polyangiaceae bacterium]|nr:hypothetical protein [Polyangiaceae bacterium]